jgi:hypothetical protein
MEESRPNDERERIEAQRYQLRLAAALATLGLARGMLRAGFDLDTRRPSN